MPNNLFTSKNMIFLDNLTVILTDKYCVDTGRNHTFGIGPSFVCIQSFLEINFLKLTK